MLHTTKHPWQKPQVKELMKNTLRPENIDMIVRTTNNGLFSLKDPAMPIIRSRDAKLQEAQGALIKSSYITMKLAEDLDQAHAKGDINPQLYDKMSDQCIHSLTLNSVAVQQLDQVRRSAFKPVLPTHLKGLTKVPPSPHTELFGNDLPTRQKELKEKAELAESLGKAEKHTSSTRYFKRNQGPQNKPYSRPPQSSSKPNWTQRNKQQDTRNQMKGQQKVSIPDFNLNFDPNRTIATCYRVWTLLTRDHTILQGVRLGFISNPPPPPPQDRATVFQPCLSTTQTTTIDPEIESLLSLKVIAPSHQGNCLWISPIFTTTNKDGTSRLILNLKKLNLLITHIPFKMESIKDVIHMIKQAVWMASVDLHHAYYSVQVHRSHSPYFSFLWQDKYYHYLRLPNEYAQAPLIFTKLLRLPSGYLRSQGHLSVVYMDDTYLQGDSNSSCQSNIANTVSLLQAMGFTINMKKSVLTPTQSLEFLGFIINSVNMTITLTTRRKSNIAEVCTKLLMKTSLKIRFVSSAIGMIIAALPAVKHGALHYRTMEADKNFALQLTEGDFDKNMTLSPQARNEVQWWVTHIYHSQRFLHPPPITTIIYSDASLEGSGATDSISTIGAPWRDTDELAH